MSQQKGGKKKGVQRDIRGICSLNQETEHLTPVWSAARWMTSDNMIYVQAKESVLDARGGLMRTKAQSVIFVKSVVSRQEFAYEF